MSEELLYEPETSQLSPYLLVGLSGGPPRTYTTHTIRPCPTRGPVSVLREHSHRRHGTGAKTPSSTNERHPRRYPSTDSQCVKWTWIRDVVMRSPISVPLNKSPTYFYIVKRRRPPVPPYSSDDHQGRFGTVTVYTHSLQLPRGPYTSTSPTTRRPDLHQTNPDPRVLPRYEVNESWVSKHPGSYSSQRPRYGNTSEVRRKIRLKSRILRTLREGTDPNVFRHHPDTWWPTQKVNTKGTSSLGEVWGSTRVGFFSTERRERKKQKSRRIVMR